MTPEETMREIRAKYDSWPFYKVMLMWYGGFWQNPQYHAYYNERLMKELRNGKKVQEEARSD